MSKLNLDAAMTQLRGEALQHLAAIDLLLNKPTAISEHTQFCLLYTSDAADE